MSQGDMEFAQPLPSSPDLSDPVSRQIRGSEKKAVWGSWLGAAGTVIFALFVGWHMPMPLFLKPGFPNPFLAVLAIIFVLLCGKAIWETLRLRRFGDPVLELTDVPVPLGGALEGRVGLSSALADAPEFSAKLQCIRSVTQNTGKNSHTVETILWSDEKKTNLLPGGIVPISIAMPDGFPETNGDNPWNRILWRLTVSAPFPGIAFREKYEIPVVGEPASSREASSSGEKDFAFASGAAGAPVTGKGVVGAIFFLLLFLIPMLGFGLYLLPRGVADIEKARASEHWPVTQGRIVGLSLVSGSSSPLIYSYAVQGTARMGDTVYPHGYWSLKSCQRLVAAYPFHRDVAVHYSPANPHDSLLLPGLRAGVFQQLLASMLLLSFAVILIVACMSVPKYAVISGNTISFREGSPVSKISGPILLLMLPQGFLLWFAT
jgi:hypothetical protein